MSDPNGWVPIGPVVVPNGQAGSHKEGLAPVSGRCTAIALDPNQPDKIIYAGAALGGVWKSTDGGLTWRPKSDFEACLGIGCIAIDPTNPQRIYVGTGEGNEGIPLIPGQGVLVSDNGGDTWTLRGNAKFARESIGQIIVDPTAPDELYAATTAGLFHSSNKGVDWTKLAVPAPGTNWVTAIQLDTSDVNNKRLFAAFAFDGIYRREGTAPFVKLRNNLPTQLIGRIEVAVAPSNPAIVYAAFGNSASSLLGIWRSTTHGDRWDPVAALPLVRGNAGAEQTLFNLVLAVHPTDPDRIFFGEVRLWRSKDAGKEWELVTDPHGNSQGLHSDQHALAFNRNNPSELWAGNDGGVCFSSDGGETWKHRNRGLHTMQYYALAQHPTRENLIFAGSQDNGMHRAAGHPAWQRVRGGDGFHCAIDPVDPTNWYGSYLFRYPLLNGDGCLAIFQSTKAGEGESFEQMSDNAWLNDFSDSGPFYIPFVHSPTETGVLYAGTTKLYRRRTTPPGWETVLLRPHATPFTTAKNIAGVISRSSFEAISAIAVAPSNTAILYVGTDDGRCFRLERGNDGLWTAVERTTGLPNFGMRDVISDIAVHPGNPDHVYVAIGYAHTSWRFGLNVPAGRIFFSPDGGQTWQPRGSAQLNVTVGGITIDHRDNPVNAIIIDPANPTHVYIGLDVGIFRSTDEGANWTPWHENLPNTAVADLQIHAPTRLMRAATYGRSIWERRLDAPAAVPPLVDLYVRDNSIDIARRDTPDDEADPLHGSRRVRWFTAADVKIDAPTFFRNTYQSPSSTLDYAGGKPDFIAFEGFSHDNPRERDDAQVYVQIHNRGPDPATNVQVRAFFNSRTTNDYPDLPADFWAAYPNANHSHPAFWLPIGPAITVPEIRPTEPAIVSWTWTVPNTPKSTVGLLVAVTNATDPVNETRRDVALVARTNKHVALREIDVRMPAAGIVALVLIGIGVAAIATAVVVSETT